MRRWARRRRWEFWRKCEVMDRWKIGISSWIIQDGNYPDFCRGQIVEFAVEFYPEQFAYTNRRAKRIEHLRDEQYEASGEVVYSTADQWVLDLGILVYQDSKPLAGAKPGVYFAGKVNLGIDPFFYFERLCKMPNIPALIYTWKIEQILRQTAPFKNQNGLLIRDPDKLGWTEIDATDAWKDDGGNASYILECSKLEHEPKHTSRTAQ